MTLSVKYLFSLLDYHHFSLFDGQQELGMLIVNTVDRSITLRAGEEGKVTDHTPYFRSFKAFERWYRFHQ